MAIDYLEGTKLYVTDNFNVRMLDRVEQSSKYFKRSFTPLTTAELRSFLNNKSSRGSKVVCKLTDVYTVALFNSIMDINMYPCEIDEVDFQLNTGDIIVYGDIVNLDRKPYKIERYMTEDTMPENIKIEWWVI